MIMVLSKPIYSKKYDGQEYIEKVADFPTPISGVITLEEDTAYKILKTVDLEGNRLVLGNNTTIYGSNANSSILTSTGLSSSTALITSSLGCKLFDLGFSNNLVFDLDGDNTTGLDWRDLNFNSCEVGRIANYTNFIADVFGFFDSYDLVFDGSINTIGISESIFIGREGETMINIPSTAAIDRRLRIKSSSFVVLTGSTGISVLDSSFVANESYILESINFSGPGTYLNGLDHTDNRSVFEKCVGIINSSNIANYYMTGNATATTISTQNIYVKVAGATTATDFNSKFDSDTVDNRAEYTGPSSGNYKITVTGSVVGANNREYGFKFAKNGSVIGIASKFNTDGGGRAESVTNQEITVLESGDYLEVFIAGLNTTTNPTIEEMNVIIERLS